jgi:hypothetical protein
MLFEPAAAAWFAEKAVEGRCGLECAMADDWVEDKEISPDSNLHRFGMKGENERAHTIT